MVSGYDKQPPEDQYQPDLGGGGRLALLLIVAVVLFANFGWILIG